MRYAKTIATVLLLLLISVPAFANRLNTAAICRIGVHDKDGAKSLGSGTLIQVGDNKCVITNRHVVNDTRYNSVEVYFPILKRSIVCRILHISREVDLAILDGNSIPLEPVTLATEGDPQKAYVAGFAGTHQLSAQRTETYYGGSKHMQLTRPVRSGDSGGPILSMSGRLLGVVWGSDNNHSECVPLTAVRRVLDAVFNRQTQYCPGGVCPPNQGQGFYIQRPQPRPQYQQPRPGGMRPIVPWSPAQATNPGNGGAAPPGGDPVTGSSDDPCTEVNAKLVLINARLDALATVGDRVTKLEDNSVTHIELNNTVESLSKLTTLIASLDARIAKEEDRKVKLEIYNDGQLLGTSEGRTTVRFDVGQLTGATP